jgi:universal stress protein E
VGAAAMPQKKVLVVVDPMTQESQPVIARAAWLAEAFGASLELFACDYDAAVDGGPVSSVWIPEPGTREHILLRHRRTLDELAKPLRARGLAVTVDAAWDYPLGDAILARVAREPPWLVAKDTAHHNVIQRTLLTNTDWQLIRDCSVPLLLVKRRELARAPVILAALDPLSVHDKPAALDDAIYRFAAGLAAKVGGALHVVHATAPPLSVEIPGHVQNLLVEEHAKAMAAFVATHPVLPENVHLLRGLAHECLQHAAQSCRADMLVMGAIARRGIKRLLIGSTAARVVDRVPCDLLIIKPAELVRPGEGAHE